MCYNILEVYGLLGLENEKYKQKCAKLGGNFWGASQQETVNLEKGKSDQPPNCSFVPIFRIIVIAIGQVESFQQCDKRDKLDYKLKQFD